MLDLAKSTIMELVDKKIDKNIAIRDVTILLVSFTVSIIIALILALAFLSFTTYCLSGKSNPLDLINDISNNLANNWVTLSKRIFTKVLSTLR